jgi:hypothetical protein
MRQRATVETFEYLGVLDDFLLETALISAFKYKDYHMLFKNSLSHNNNISFYCGQAFTNFQESHAPQ